ncbi:Pimeloyl-ACP methyl ester carboxylesterase [Alteribacillus persepolensis]|uniref:Pimeloyl-ACP methyl ester carboxylesterase n=1 Tax=Alteribacillus persepolensis TaxID=568899 RepID=A0A1G8AGB0_9BACI|nr:alpha/beta hydrolase [Alteribacillus persepolensis]SDH19988.1 Pimeloyl-ACP methyl ester carboxylesterase [Alteribacillus persepolensis]
MNHVVIENRAFTIEVPENKALLRGNVHAPKEQNEAPVVIICHGFKGFKDWNFFPYLADCLAEAGIYAIRFNFSHNGVNETDFDELEKFAVNTYTKEQADLDALWQHIQKRKLPFSEHFQTEHTGVLGHSRGGANAIVFAAEHPAHVRAAVTWNGVPDVDFFSEALKRQVREEGIAYMENKRTKQNMPLKRDVLDDIEQNKQRYALLSHLEKLKAPVYVIQGDADGEWLVNGAKKMEQTAPIHSLFSIKGGGHTFNASHPLEEVPSQLEEAIQETTKFFTQHLTF